MSFLLVFVEDCLHLVMKLPVDLLQLRGDVLMHRAFAYPELFRCRAHCRVVFYYIMSEYDTSFLICFPKRIFLQKLHPRCINLFFTLLCPQGVPRTFPFSHFMRGTRDLCITRVYSDGKMCYSSRHRPPLPSEVSIHMANLCPHSLHLNSCRK